MIDLEEPGSALSNAIKKVGLEIAAFDERVKNTGEALDGKITRLAKNQDETTAIQRRVLERLDQRVTKLDQFHGDEEGKTQTQLQTQLQKIFNLEIKFEKIVPLTQDSIDRIEMHRRRIETLEREVKRFEATESAISAHEKAIEA